MYVASGRAKMMTNSDGHDRTFDVCPVRSFMFQLRYIISSMKLQSVSNFSSSSALPQGR